MMNQKNTILTKAIGLGCIFMVWSASLASSMEQKIIQITDPASHKATIWRSLDDMLPKIPEALQDLIPYTGSTTQLMEAKGGLQVTSLEIRRAKAWEEEAAFLGLPNEGILLIREVVLSVVGKPWLFARTIIPSQTLEGEGRALQDSGSKSLGKVLFADPSLKRSAFEVAEVSKGDDLFDLAMHDAPGLKAKKLWARRSIFTFYGQPLLVTEVFYPHANTL